MEAGLYLKPYDLQDGRLTLKEKLKIRIMPRYVGKGENGKKFVDNRITFVLLDMTSGQWPVMAKMNARAARNLALGLKQATEAATER